MNVFYIIHKKNRKKKKKNTTQYNRQLHPPTPDSTKITKTTALKLQHSTTDHINY